MIRRMNSRRARLLTVPVSLACLAALALPGTPASRGVAVVSQERHSVAAVNGPLLVLDTRGGMAQLGPAEGRILAARDGMVVRALARGLTFPFTGGIAPSPRGRYVAYGADPTVTSANPPQTQGLWLVPGTGGSPRRLLLPPRSTEGNTLGIGPVAWSPDRYMLAYAVEIASDVAFNPNKDRALGVWLARYDTPHPRLGATLAGLGATMNGPEFVAALSWMPDGRTLVASVRTEAGLDVLAGDWTSGKTRVLVAGGQDAATAAGTGALAYLTSEAGTPAGMALWVSDARGRHARKLISARSLLSSPVWSPDGRTIAYIDELVGRGRGTTVVRTVDVTSGRIRTVLAANQPGQPLLLSGGQFQRLAWMRARV